MKVKELIKILEGLNQEMPIKVACDEEWNAIFNDIEVEESPPNRGYVIFGLSGSEEDEEI